MVYKTDVVRTEPDVIDVDMTKYHYAMVAMSVTTTGLAGATGYLWYRLRRNEQYMEALKEYISRLVSTDCGKEAYETFLDDVEDEPADEEIADLSQDEPIPYMPTEPKPVLRKRARDVQPNV